MSRATSLPWLIELWLRVMIMKGEDRISNLPNDIIHIILSLLDIRLAVQTCVLSKRWKLIWTSLPFLTFTRYKSFDDGRFIYKFFTNRNNNSPIFKLKLSFQCSPDPFMSTCLEHIIKYAIAHNVQDLTVNIKGFELNPAWLSSTHVKKLILKLDFDEFSESDCWHLPALKTLHLTQLGSITYTLPESYLICFHSLETLFVDVFDLPISVSLPALTTLRLSSCKLPPTFWDFPALLTLTLDNIVFSDETSEFLIALVNLRKLTLFLRKNMMTDCYINCPQLMNLDINTCMNTISKHPGKIIVLSHKICNFSSVGFFAITFEESELETVNIKLRDQRYKTIASWKNMKDYYPRAIPMFPEVGSAKILTLDSETIEVLPGIFLPFSFSILKLSTSKYVEVQGYKD